jgi:hypothetical protein
VVNNKNHDGIASSNMGSWIILFDDAVKAASMIMQAPKESIAMVNSELPTWYPKFLENDQF